MLQKLNVAKTEGLNAVLCTVSAVSAISTGVYTFLLKAIPCGLIFVVYKNN